MAKRTCSIDGCEGTVNCRGWCGKHYRAWQKYGDPAGPPPTASLPGERWRAVPGYEGLYSVSDMGRVRSFPRERTPGCILKQAVRPDGHLAVGLKDGTRWAVLVHRLVALAFIGGCPVGMEVRHLNGNPADNRLENLKYGTRSENNLDAVSHGTHVNSRKTHCKPGNHEFTEANTRIERSGSRRCLMCEREGGQRRGEGQAA